MDPAPQANPGPTPSARPRRRWLRASAFAIALVAALAAGGYAFLSGEAGVEFAVRELALRSGGRLQFEGATGSLLDAVRVRRLTWRGPEATVTAIDVTLTWRPTALWSRGVVVQALGARHIELDVNASNAAVPLPASLALPFEIAIERLVIGHLDWRVGPRRGTIRGLALTYAGGAAGHRCTNLALEAEPGALSGDATIGANPPFPVGGHLALKGNAALKGAESTLALSGTLASLAVDGSGSAGSARFTAHVALAPLAAVPLQELTLDAGGIDLAAWDKTLPTTRLDAVVRAQPAADGLVGKVDATNTLAGSIDAGKVPLRALSATFAWRADALALDELVAELPGGGRATGRASIALGTRGAGAWSLDVRDVDLRQLYAPLIATRLRGTITADLDRDRQHVSGDVVDRAIAGGLALGFAAVVADGTIDVERFRARAGGSELAGHGRVALHGERAFLLDATAKRFDPARFGDFPAGVLDGRIGTTGALEPAWRASVDVALAPGSKLAGVALSGTAVGTIAPNTVHNARIALQAGSAKLVAHGSAGEASDVLTVAIDAPSLADLAPLFPAAVPRTLTGSVHAKAELHGGLRGGGIDVEAKGEALTLGPALAIAALDVRFALAAGTALPGGNDLAARVIRLDATARSVVVPQGTFTTARASGAGTLARHTVNVAFASDDVAIEAAARGGVREPLGTGADSALAWSGTLDALEGRGALALRLAVPAAITISRGQVRVGETRVAVADGEMRLTDFRWDDGKISTHGSFTAVPLATAARIAGVPLPFVSTLTLGGEWSLDATPRLNGTVKVRRESGDLRLQRDAAVDPASLALGITSLELAAQFTNDAVDATAAFRSTRGGSATAKLALGAVATAPPGRIGADAPLALTASAELPTLQLLQPWIGTTAVVDGRASADLTARGTVGRAVLAGALRAEALRVDAPQYGVHFRDGRLAARLAEGNVVVDEIVLSAGAGQFRASGTVAGARSADASTAARIAWHADKFRLFNRPDLRLVVDGEGTVTVEKGRLALSGALKAKEGRIVYVSDPGATLGDDVVVKGWPRQTAPTLRAADLPLTVDLALDFGDQLTVASGGLDTGLSGTVRVTTGPRGFIGRGSIRAVNGTYFAFGQKLVIDPGRLIFDGPLDNPGLDIVALRRNLAVEAGVAVTGTVRVPIIQLTSNPSVPDGEKLSWLVLGQGLDRTSGTDIAALQAASAILLGRNSGAITTTIARSVGLDDVAIRGTSRASRGASGSPDAAGQVVAVGKRLSDRLSLVYEQGLTVANSALKIEYSLTRSLTLRAETGVVSGVGIHYNHSFE